MKIAFLTILMVIALANAALPLENPLNLWLYHSEATGVLLPGELPDQHTISLQPELNSLWLWQLLQDKSALPSGSDIFASRTTIRTQAVHTDSDLVSRAGLAYEIFSQPLSWLSLHEQLSVWTGSDGNPPSDFAPFHYGLEHGRHLYVDWGYAQAVAGPLQLSMGRIPVRWGPGRFSQLMISGKAPAMDMFKVKLNLGDNVRFTGFTSTINSDSSTWLSAHRLDITPFKNLRIGLSESILYTSDGIDLAYANVFIPWYPVQWNERVDDNAFMCIDATYQPFRGLALYGEFLIDDIQYDNIHDVPNKLGYTAGIDCYLPRYSVGAIVEYTAIQRYVYSQRKINNFYLHDSRIIGAQLGPDADQITASLSYAGIPNITTELRGTYTRHGEGNVYEGWPDSFPNEESFPSGNVITTEALELNIKWYSNWVELGASAKVTTDDESFSLSATEVFN